MRQHCAALWMWVVLSACDRQPAGVPAEASPERGRAVYLAHCTLCHGEDADGRGARRTALSTRPADFTSPVWRRSTTFAAVTRVIREGKRGTAMPASPALGDDEVRDLAAYLLSVAEVR